MPNKIIFVLFALISFYGPGCSRQQDRIERITVFGEVTFQGVPLEAGILSLIPDAGTEASPSGAEITQGKYRVTNKGGVAPGKYIVKIMADRIVAEATPVDPDSVVTEQLIPEKYNSSSMLTLDVPSGVQKLEANFALEK